MYIWYIFTINMKSEDAGSVCVRVCTYVYVCVCACGVKRAISRERYCRRESAQFSARYAVSYSLSVSLSLSLLVFLYLSLSLYLFLFFSLSFPPFPSRPRVPPPSLFHSLSLDYSRTRSVFSLSPLLSLSHTLSLSCSLTPFLPLSLSTSPLFPNKNTCMCGDPTTRAKHRAIALGARLERLLWAHT